MEAEVNLLRERLEKPKYQLDCAAAALAVIGGHRIENVCTLSSRMKVLIFIFQVDTVLYRCDVRKAQGDH